MEYILYDSWYYHTEYIPYDRRLIQKIKRNLLELVRDHLGLLI